MSEHVLGASAARGYGLTSGGIGSSVAAVLDRIRARRVERPLSAFPAADGATDHELTLLGQVADPFETLRHARLTAATFAGHP